MRALDALEDLEPLFKISHTFVCKKVPGKITDKYMKNLKQSSGNIQAQVRTKIFLVQSFGFVALVYNLYFYQNSGFTEIIRH